MPFRPLPGGKALCDDHPELGPLDEHAAYLHLKAAHPQIVKWAGRVIHETARANSDGAPQQRRGKRRGRHGRRKKKGR